MTSGKLTRRGPHANAPARLPGLQASRVADPAARQALEALREWVEVRLGARGDGFERAVTERDLAQRLEALNTEIAALKARAAPTVEAADAAGQPVDLSGLENAMRQLERALTDQRTLFTRRVQELADAIDALAARPWLTRADIVERPNHWIGAQTVQSVDLSVEADGNVWIDGRASNAFTLLVDQNCVIEDIDDLVEGAEYRLVLTQDAVGGHTVGFGDMWLTDAVVDDTPGAVTVVRAVAVFDEAAEEWRLAPAEGSVVAGGGGGPDPIDVRGASWSGGGAAIDPVGADEPCVHCPRAGTITKVVVLGEGGPGSCVIDIKKDVYASYPPGAGDSIVAAAPPNIAAGHKYSSTVLTGWTTSVAAGDILKFSMTSCSGFTGLRIFLEITP